MAIEDHMVGVFPSPTKLTEIIPGPIMFTNLVCSWEFPTHSLPQKYFNLKRNLGPPNILESRALRAIDQSRIQRLNSKAARGGMGPGEREQQDAATDSTLQERERDEVAGPI